MNKLHNNHNRCTTNTTILRMIRSLFYVSVVLLCWTDLLRHDTCNTNFAATNYNIENSNINSNSCSILLFANAQVETPQPTPEPTKNPTKVPTKKPTKNPTKKPTKNPTHNPTKKPTKNPTHKPTKRPSQRPTKTPTKNPTQKPTKSPTHKPSRTPTKNPTRNPTTQPSESPTDVPSETPTDEPTTEPTEEPTEAPIVPSRSPTDSPTDEGETRSPTAKPTPIPTFPPTFPITLPPVPVPTFITPPPFEIIIPTVFVPTGPIEPQTFAPTKLEDTPRPTRQKKERTKKPTPYPTFKNEGLVTQSPIYMGGPSNKPTPIENIGMLVIGPTFTLAREDGVNAAAPVPAAITYVVDNVKRPTYIRSLPPASKLTTGDPGVKRRPGQGEEQENEEVEEGGM